MMNGVGILNGCSPISLMNHNKSGSALKSATAAHDAHKVMQQVINKQPLQRLEYRDAATTY